MAPGMALDTSNYQLREKKTTSTGDLAAGTVGRENEDLCSQVMRAKSMTPGGRRNTVKRAILQNRDRRYVPTCGLGLGLYGNMGEMRSSESFNAIGGAEINIDGKKEENLDAQHT